MLLLTNLENENVPEIFCEAIDLVKLPPIVVDSCTELVQRNNASLQAIAGSLDSLRSDISGLSAKLTNVQPRVPIPSSANPPTSSQPSTRPPRTLSSQPAPVDRRDNLIIFWLEETRTMSETMDSVQNMVEFLIGRTAQVKDLYRLGKKPESGQPPLARARPVLLKLASTWDRRLVLNSRFNLREYSVKGVFVREDLTPEIRQQRREKFAARKRSSQGGSESVGANGEVSPASDQ